MATTNVRKTEEVHAIAVGSSILRKTVNTLHMKHIKITRVQSRHAAELDTHVDMDLLQKEFDTIFCGGISEGAKDPGAKDPDTKDPGAKDPGYFCVIQCKADPDDLHELVREIWESAVPNRSSHGNR